MKTTESTPIKSFDRGVPCLCGQCGSHEEGIENGLCFHCGADAWYTVEQWKNIKMKETRKKVKSIGEVLIKISEHEDQKVYNTLSCMKSNSVMLELIALEVKKIRDTIKPFGY